MSQSSMGPVRRDDVQIHNKAASTNCTLRISRRGGAETKAVEKPNTKARGEKAKARPVLARTGRRVRPMKQTDMQRLSSATMRERRPIQARALRTMQPKASFQLCSCHSFQRRFHMRGVLSASDDVGFENFVEVEVEL